MCEETIGILMSPLFLCDIFDVQWELIDVILILGFSSHVVLRLNREKSTIPRGSSRETNMAVYGRLQVRKMFQIPRPPISFLPITLHFHYHQYLIFNHVLIFFVFESRDYLVRAGSYPTGRSVSSL